LKTLQIVWINGGFPGSHHDLTIARTKLINQIQLNETLLADKAYVGDSHFLTPYKPATTNEQQNWNQQVNQQQAKIEHINSEFKKFNLFRNVYKGKDYKLYSSVFVVVSNVINLEKLIK
jgi:hypothetical protein